MIFFSFSSRPAKAFYEDGIIAVVNDAIITLRDLQEYLGVVYMSLMSSGLSESEILQAMAFYEANGLEKLIEDKLMIDAAKQKELIIPKEAIDNRIERIQSRYDSRESFVSDLISQGMTISDLRQKLTDQIKSQYIEDIEVRSRIFISPQDVSLFYSENIDMFKTPERIDVGSILIDHSDNPIKAKQKAEEILNLFNQKKINDPISFELFLKNFSDSILEKEFADKEGPFPRILPIGIITRGETLPEIEDVIFDLLPGEISPIIENNEGFFIFFVKERLSSEILSLSEAKDKIHNILFQKRFQEQREKWLENLRKDAYIDIRI